ncbi:hypothetical protein HID58_049051, partial [Brassica napus]
MSNMKKKFIGPIMELIDRVVLSKESSEVASTENLFFGKAVEKEESDFRDQSPSKLKRSKEGQLLIFMLVKERSEAMKKEVSLPRSASESRQQLTV